LIVEPWIQFFRTAPPIALIPLVIVIFGNGAKTDIYHTVSEICQAKQGYCFLDTYGEILQASLSGNYFFAKPNRRELLEYMELQAEVREQKVIEAAWRLLEKGSTNLMISMGEKGGEFVADTLTSLVKHGASVIRLDAFAYGTKKVETLST
jgi:fructose-1-phosphate kinase PfkB-like protein